MLSATVPAPAIGDFDFIAQFPAGSSIPSGGVIVVAFDGAGFFGTFGQNADFEILSTDAGTPDMLATDVGASAGLTNSGENVVLFSWDGMSDLVQDVDMLNVGTPSASNAIASKTGVSVDGPNADTTPTTYLMDVLDHAPAGGRSCIRFLHQAHRAGGFHRNCPGNRQRYHR